MDVGELRKVLSRGWSGLLVAAGVATAALMLYGAFCAFINFRFGYFDYGIYTQALWNCGHGNGFHMYVDRDYLNTTHLSFTLAPLGLLFWIWDHPFLLSFVQWLSYCLGAVILYRAARRHGIAPELNAAVFFFYLGYVFCQWALFSQFHGVSLFLGLIPWLYYCLCFSRKLAWLPLLCILGLREDGFIPILPMLLYFGLRRDDPWRPARHWALAALVYGVLALTVFFPWMTGQSILERRNEEIPQDPSVCVNLLRDCGDRAVTLVCVALPYLALAGRRMWPALLFPAAAFLQANLSLVMGQYLMRRQYGVAFTATLACGLLETLAWRGRHDPKATAWGWVRSASLVAAVLIAHVLNGLLPGGPHWISEYGGFSKRGLTLVELQKQIPKEGVLATSDRLSAFCANRRDLVLWNPQGWPHAFNDYTSRVEWVLLDANAISGGLGEGVLNWVSNGTFGVVSYQDEFAILNRAAPTGANSRLLSDVALSRSRVWIPKTPLHGGRTVVRHGSLWRHWEGNGSRAPINLSYGGYRVLEPGRYQACFSYAAEPPRRTVRGYWGWFSVHSLNEGAAIAKADIDPVPADLAHPRVQRLTFETGQATNIELRVTGGDAALWVASGWFERLTPLP